MNKALVWLGVLVVVIIVVVVLARGGGDEATKGPVTSDAGDVFKMPATRGHMTVEKLRGRIRDADPSALGYLKRDMGGRRLYQVGSKATVVMAETDAQGGWYAELDVDPAANDGVDVTLKFDAAALAGMTVPAVGEECEFVGEFVGLALEGEHVVVDLKGKAVRK